MMDRTKSIGGSDIAGVLGISPWQTPLDVWLEKAGQCEPKRETLAMRRGTFMEPFLAEEFEREHDEYRVVLRDPAEPDHQYREQSDAAGFPATCSLDGLVIAADSYEPVGPFEGKTGCIWTRAGWDSEREELPDHYFVQVQWQLWLTDMQVAWATADHYHPTRMIFVPVKRHNGVIKAIVKEGARFWNEYVVPGVKPPPTGRDSETIRRMFPQSSDETVEWQDASSVGLVSKLVETREQVARLSDYQKELESSVKLQMENASIAHCAGHKIMWKTQKQSRIDVTELRKTHPRIAKKFTAEKPTRPLRIYPAKGE